MNRRRSWLVAAWMLVGAMATSPLRAQFAVIDVASVTQLLQQVQALASLIEVAQAQLGQAHAEFQALTGQRGMQNLLSGTTRNYLPTDWAQIAAVLQGSSGSFATLAGDLQRNLGANAVLPDAQIAGLSANARAQLAGARGAIALLQSVSQEALANASSRFAELQQLIDAIPSAQDPKGALDLQARIAAEQGMLQNEQTKLQVLFQLSMAQQWAAREQAQERASVGHGNFATRFEPSPF